jgi:Tfp pilus assembly protein PilN
MINLLPPETKAQIAAARTNRLLLRYNLLLLLALAFLLAAIVVVYFYLSNTKTSAEAAIVDSRSRVSDYSAVEAEASSFRQNLSNAKQILNSDIKYTKVILDIAGVLPSGVVLDTLSLDSATFGSPMVLTANVKDYPTVLALKDSLQGSSVFSNVSIQSITNGSDGAYPLSAAFSVTIRKDAAQ